MEGVTYIDGPNWPNVAVRFTSRLGGVSLPPFGALNVGTHVGDVPEHVAENRRRIGVDLPGPIVWLDQVHGTDVISADGIDMACAPIARADAAIVTRTDRVLAIMVADCLPVVITDADGSIVGAAHAGWRGLASGVLEATVQAMRAARPQAKQWRAWIGPAIGADAFQVGEDVVQACLASDAGAASCFVTQPAHPGKSLADLSALATRRLVAAGVAEVTCAQRCTYSDPEMFFSYRRDGTCGRMVLLAWRRE